MGATIWHWWYIIIDLRMSLIFNNKCSYKRTANCNLVYQRMSVLQLVMLSVWLIWWYWCQRTIVAIIEQYCVYIMLCMRMITRGQRIALNPAYFEKWFKHASKVYLYFVMRIALELVIEVRLFVDCTEENCRKQRMIDGSYTITLMIHYNWLTNVTNF